jgi:hypothetical protein
VNRAEGETIRHFHIWRLEGTWKAIDRFIYLEGVGPPEVIEAEIG